MASELTLYCWIIGDDSTFDITIDPSRSISQLKKFIVTENPHYFQNMDARELQLCIPNNIPDTAGAMQSFRFEGHPVPRGSDKISNIFNNGPPEGYIHVAIKGPTYNPPLPAKPVQIKRKRWDALNSILDAHKKAKTTAEGASSTAYSAVSWKSIQSVYDPITRKMTIQPKEVPAEDLESLHKYLCRVGFLLGPLQEGKEAKRLHLIAPILFYLGGLFDNQMIILIEESIPGINIHTNGNFEFVIQVGGKKICIVEAKKESIQQVIAQNLLGCEAVADAEFSQCVLGIVTNFIQWVFFRSLQDYVEQENITMQIEEAKPTRDSLKLIAEKIYSLLSDDGETVDG